jgi:hypothetical protein
MPSQADPFVSVYYVFYKIIDKCDVVPYALCSTR